MNKNTFHRKLFFSFTGKNILNYFTVFQVPPEKLQNHFISIKAAAEDLTPFEGNNICLCHVSEVHISLQKDISMLEHDEIKFHSWTLLFNHFALV